MRGAAVLARAAGVLAAAVVVLGIAPSVLSPVDAAGRTPTSRPASIGAPARSASERPATVEDALRCARPAHFVQFREHRAVVAVAVGMAESNCVASATGHNGPTGGCPHGSTDRGLWQINSCYHSEVSDKCAYRPRCNARAAKHISDHGKNWTPWSAYNSGAYRAFLTVSRAAVHEVYDGIPARSEVLRR